MQVLRVSHSAVVRAWRERERAIARAGATVDLLSARRWDEAGQVVPLVPDPGERVTGIATLGRHPALFAYNPIPIWRALGRRYDVLDIHEEPYALATAEVLLIRALRRNPVPYVLYSAQNLDKRQPPPFRWFERHALRHAAGLSVCNDAAGRIATRKGLPGVPTYIPLGIDPGQFTPGPPPARERGDGAIVVGYAGRLAPHKGVDVLLAAVAGDERLQLRIAGAGPQEQDLRRHAAASTAAGRIHFLGALAQAALPDFYRSLDVLAVPSVPTAGWTEQFGRVAVEAMACGIPVVASDTGALPDVVGGAGLLVYPGDPAALAAALGRVGSDPALRAQLRSRGLDRARECTWDRVGQQYARLYAAAAHRPTGPVAGPQAGSVAGRGVEIVVVAYGRPDLVRQVLGPVAAFPVTVVDNSSSPEVSAVCADLGVRYLDPGRNGGFGAGVNVALARRQDPDADVLLLNPDAVVTPETIRTLHRALLADPDLASVGPAQVHPHGAVQRVGWPYPSPARSWAEALGLGPLLPRRTAYVVGSVLLVRAEALRQVGGFDEGFFLYAEEADWARRASRLGWRHAVVPEARAIHTGAATSPDPARREVHFHAGQERFHRKHYGAVGWQTARLAQLAGSGARTLLLPEPRRAEARRRLRLYARGPVGVENERLPERGGPVAATRGPR